MDDKRVIACNYRETTNVAPKGALAYVSFIAGDAENINVLVRSHSGRWVNKWERSRRLGNYRFKTLPPQHPLYSDDRISGRFGDRFGKSDLERLRVIEATHT